MKNNPSKVKKVKLQRRRRKVRSKIIGTAQRPRLCASRSDKHFYAQVIDDQKSVTLLAAHDREIKKDKLTKTDKAKELGQLIAKKCLTKKIKQVVFDRGGRPYHGRIKALAEGARAGGLKF